MGSSEDEAHRLRSLLEVAPSSPGNIVAACHAVESVCRHLPRMFFRVCFPLLLRRLFGFEDPGASSGGWLSIVSQPGNESVAGAIISLLAPGGTLFRALLDPENENLVRYVFPSERLPDWVRRVLTVDRGGLLLEHVSILFRNRLREDLAGSVHVELDAFQYYIFWFAYYAVCKESFRMVRTKTSVSRSSQFLTQIENWASSIPGLHLHHSLQQGKLVSPLHPYLQLLQLYLSHFVGPTMFRRDKHVLTLWQEESSVTHADVLVQSLIDFWLIDDDPCPFSVNICKSLQLHSLAPAPVYIPPGRDLTDAVRLLINYFSALLQTHLGNHDHFFTSPESISPAKGFGLNSPSSTDLKPSSMVNTAPASPYLQSLQRPLYRFCLRAFCYWPVGTPPSKILPIVDLWLLYLEPWSAILLVPKENTVQPGSRIVVDETSRLYSGYWQGYVLSNYPFYTSLVSHFLEFAMKFLLIDMEMIFQTTCKVLSVLSKSSDLLDLLRRVDAAYTDHFLERHHYLSSPFAERIPAIQEQLQDWEEGATRPDQEQPEMLSSNFQTGSPGIRFFSSTEYGGHRILQSMILQAEAEIRACPADKPPMSPKTLEIAKGLVKEVFNQDILQPLYRTESQTARQEEGEQTTGIGLQRRGWSEVKYKGDWMRRPIETQEIAWLVRLLVYISDRLNAYFGFSREGGRVESVGDAGEAAGNIRESSGNAGVPEVLKRVVVGLQGTGRFVLRELRKHDFRINLRPLANKQVICLTIIIYLVYWLIAKLAGLISNR